MLYSDLGISYISLPYCTYCAHRYTQPLFIQALMGLKGLYDAKLVSIYIFGKAADGDLKRPFAAGGMFGCKHRLPSPLCG